MTIGRTLDSDPIEEARRQWVSHGWAEAADGMAALAAFEAAATPYDLLLTDVVMPGALNGKALGEAVSRRWPATAIAFMSGYSEGIVASSLLTKPFRKHDLARHVREALDLVRA